MTSSSSTKARTGSRGPSRYRPLPASLLAEGGRVAVSQPVLAIAVALICAGVVLTTLATSGRTVGAERAVLARIDDAGTRAIAVIDDRPTPGLNSELLDAIRRLDAVAWAIGLGPIEDVRPVGLSGGTAVPARTVSGISPELVLSPTSGSRVDALVARESQRRLGYVAAAGTVETSTGRQYPVAGTFTATGPLADLQGTILLIGGAPGMPLRRITIEVETAEYLGQVADAVRTLVGPGGQGGVSIEVSDDLVLAQMAVRGELAGFGRGIVIQALAAGLVLMAGAVLAGVNARRRDFGRRRALGATRGQLVGVVVAQALWSAVPGVTAGALIGSGLVAALAGNGPGWQYPLAVAVLTVVGAAGSAVIPAGLAAARDPVVALRVP